MDKKLQDLAWSVLPKEFKEEVKKDYAVITENPEWDEAYNCALEETFGIHNLTSDAEGEEMLTCEKSIAQHMVKSAIRSIQIHDFEGNTIASQNMATFNRGIKFALDQLFGSKCLPDETKDGTMDETKEPKFKVGGIVRFKYCCTPHRIDGFKMLDGVMLYQVGEVWAEESDLAPYTAPKENANLSQETSNSDKHFDTILKKGFSKERRLNIAAMAMQGLLANPNNNASLRETIADALNCADALLHEVEKGGSK